MIIHSVSIHTPHCMKSLGTHTQASILNRKDSFHKPLLKWPSKTKKSIKRWVGFFSVNWKYIAMFFFGFCFLSVLNVMENYLFSTTCRWHFFDMAVDHYFYNQVLLWFICMLCVSWAWNRLDASQVLRSLLYFAACPEGCVLVCPSLLQYDAIRFGYTALKITIMS